jgi:hypothetical protein
MIAPEVLVYVVSRMLTADDGIFYGLTGLTMAGVGLTSDIIVH